MQKTVQQQMTRIAAQEDDEINLENPQPTDIAKYNEGFQNVRIELEDYIDPLNKLPVSFGKYGIMTSDEADEFDCTKPHAARDLLKKMNACLKQDSRKCLLMLKALIDDDQIHIAKYIVSSGKNTRSPDRVLTKEERDAIDRNMFCLEKLVRPHVNDYLFSLAGLKCITGNHKDWVINWRDKNKDVYQLFEIMKKRSVKHLTIFNRLLIENGHTIIADVLEKGGVVEIISHLQGIKNPTDREKIERGIVEQLCGYVDDDNKNRLNEEQKLFIDRLIALLYEHQIRFVRCYLTNSICLYFQCETDKSQNWLVDFCKNGGLKSLYQILQPELTKVTNFDIDVNMTNSSKKHSMDTQSQYKAGTVLTSL